MFLLIIFSLLCKEDRAKVGDEDKSAWLRMRRRFIVVVSLCVLFGIGWGAGIAATEGFRNLVVATIVQIIFIVLTAFHGLYLFLMYCLRLEDARNQWKLWMNKLFCNECQKKDLIQSTLSKSSKLSTFPRGNEVKCKETAISSTLEKVSSHPIHKQNDNITKQSEAIVLESMRSENIPQMVRSQDVFNEEDEEEYKEADITAEAVAEQGFTIVCEVDLQNEIIIKKPSYNFQ